MSCQSTADVKWMAEALRLAKKGRFTTSPNPRVGCVIVKDGRVIGRGWTQPGGRPRLWRQHQRWRRLS